MCANASARRASGDGSAGVGKIAVLLYFFILLAAGPVSHLSRAAGRQTRVRIGGSDIDTNGGYGCADISGTMKP